MKNVLIVLSIIMLTLFFVSCYYEPIHVFGEWKQEKKENGYFHIRVCTAHGDMEEEKCTFKAAEIKNNQLISTCTRCGIETEDKVIINGKPMAPTDVYSFSTENNAIITALSSDIDIASLESISIPVGVEGLKGDAIISGFTVNGGVLSNAIALKSVELPDTLLTIGPATFSSCTSLERVKLPENLKEIGEDAFYRCESLAELVIPDSVTKIGACAFWDCKIKSIKIPSGVKRIEKNTFMGSSNGSLEAVELPEGLEYIGLNAFCNNPNLKNISIPSTVTTIDKQAFLGDGALESIVIPQSVETIGEKAFFNCTKLKTVTFEGKTLDAVKNNLATWGFTSGATIKCSDQEYTIQ